MKATIRNDASHLGRPLFEAARRGAVHAGHGFVDLSQALKGLVLPARLQHTPERGRGDSGVPHNVRKGDGAFGDQLPDTDQRCRRHARRTTSDFGSRQQRKFRNRYFFEDTA